MMRDREEGTHYIVPPPNGGAKEGDGHTPHQGHNPPCQRKNYTTLNLKLPPYKNSQTPPLLWYI